jgi:Rieske Fe-S protein
MRERSFVDRRHFLRASGAGLVCLTGCAPRSSLAPSNATPASRPPAAAPGPAALPAPACAATIGAGSLGDLKPGQSRLLRRDEGDEDDYSILVCRDGRGVYAVEARCTHMRCLVKFDGRGFACPCHGSRYDLDGRVVSGPAPGPLAHYALCVDGGGVIRVDPQREVAQGERWGP